MRDCAAPDLKERVEMPLSRRIILSLMAGGILALPASLASVHAQPVGEWTRTPWTGSRIAGSPEAPRPFVTQPVFSSLLLTNPVDVAWEPRSDRAWALHLNGMLISFDASGDGADAATVLDLKSKYADLSQCYGFTFHPQFRENGHIFVAYSLRPKGVKSRAWRMSRFKASGSKPPRIDSSSEKVFINMEMNGHNGGCLKFGPEGFLYVSVGDGHPPSPPDGLHTGQDLSDLRANILRIDVDRPDGERAYSIPPDNPFVNTPGARPEIWAYGFRNPWRMSFHPKTGELWLGDVGWEMWEMVHRVTKGGNHGWSIREGSQSIHPNDKPGPTPIRPPVVQHPHTESRSVTGGFVYRGSQFPELAGGYLYGDYVTGKIWGLWHDGAEVVRHEEIADTTIQIITFGEDHAGELLVVGYDGSFHRLKRNPTRESNADFPKRLSETGLFASTADQRPAPGVIPYGVKQGLWTDNAVAQRFIGLPGMSTIGVHQRNQVPLGKLKGEWAFPADTVFARTVGLEMEVGNPESLRRLETQVLHYDGEIWQPYNYIWNDEQTDAVLADSKGFDRSFEIRDASVEGGRRKQNWRFASRTECLTCHIVRTGGVHGFVDWQLAGGFNHAGGSGDQLGALARMGLFEDPVKARKPGGVPGRVQQAKADEEARAYLHVNCAHCHRRGGGGGATMDLRYSLPLAQTGVLGEAPSLGGFGIAEPQIVAPGEITRSVLWYRMAKTGPGRMPHIGTRMADKRGLELLGNWIENLPGRVGPATLSGEASKGELEAKLRAKRRALESAQRRLRYTRLTQAMRDSKSSPSDRADAMRAMLNGTEDAIYASRRLGWEWDRLKPDVRQSILDSALAHSHPNARDLFERFVPEDKRVKRLGIDIDPDGILSLKGDGARGRAVFFRESGASCMNCHQVGGEGRDFGPDLSRIGEKYSKGRMLDAILNPNWTIHRDYVQHDVETTEDDSYSGFIQSRDETQLVMRLPNDVKKYIPIKQLASLRPSQLSAMPRGLLQGASAQDAADLIAFLTAQKREAPAGGARTGDPSVTLQADEYQHTIPRAKSGIAIDGKFDEADWRSAPSVGGFHFPWEAGANEPTEAKLLWDEEFLYVAFNCADASIRGERTERDSPVYHDDCVELFVSPDPDRLEMYFNIEMNVKGARLDHFHPKGVGSKAEWNPTGIRISTTVQGTLNQDGDADRSWRLEAAIPFAAYSEIARNTPPQTGDVWRLNLNRLNYDRPGGQTRLQRSQWAPGDPDKASFHAPQWFGKVVFGE